jgi:hypothetical protein
MQKSSFARTIRTPLIATIAMTAALSLFVPTGAFAEPIANIEQLSSFSPASTSTSGSVAVANNADSGVTLAAWAAPAIEPGESARVQVAVIGVDGLPGPVATYQPVNEFLGGPGNSNPISIDAGANGGFILTWNDSNGDNAIYGILAGADGGFIGDAFTISSNTDYSDIETATAAWSPSEARYLVSWKARVLDVFPSAANDQQLVGRFIDAAGTGIGDDILVTDIAEGIDNSQDIAWGTSSWVVVGVDYAADMLRAVTVQGDGTVGEAIQIPTPSAGGSTGPAIAFNNVVKEFLITAKDNNGDIWGQRLSADSSALGVSLVLAAGADGGKANVSATGTQGWSIAWHNHDATDVFGLAVDTAGAAVGVAEVVSSGADDRNVESNFRPGVAFSAVTGQTYIIWTRYVTADNASNVVLRAWYTAPGVPLVTTPTQVTPPATVTDLTAAPVPMLAATGSENLIGLSVMSALALLVGLLFVARRRFAA